MSLERQDQDHLESACLYALQALSASEIPSFEAHLSSCLKCQEEVAVLRPVIDSFVSWPTDVLRPSASLWDRLSRRICDESGAPPFSPASAPEVKLEWEEMGEGFLIKRLSIDTKTNRVTLLVRLGPGASYPAHRHRDSEELYVLLGEVWIDDKKLQAGDFLRAEAGTVDHRVWTESGCTCVLFASLKDTLL